MTKKLTRVLTTMPTQIDIGPYPYKVSIKADFLRIDEDLPRNKIGTCWPSGCEIDLSLKGLVNPEKAVEILLHECLHGMYSNVGLTNIKKPTEEDVVSLLGIGLTDLFKKNPHLLKWIGETLK